MWYKAIQDGLHGSYLAVHDILNPFCKCWNLYMFKSMNSFSDYQNWSIFCPFSWKRRAGARAAVSHCFLGFLMFNSYAVQSETQDVQCRERRIRYKAQIHTFKLSINYQMCCCFFSRNLSVNNQFIILTARTLSLIHRLKSKLWYLRSVANFVVNSWTGTNTETFQTIPAPQDTSWNIIFCSDFASSCPCRQETWGAIK